MSTQLAFYKGKGNLIDKAIRWWTKSEYSHVELVHNGVWYSTSPRLLKVEKRHIIPQVLHWDYLEVEVDEKHIDELYLNTAGAKYDWLGIFLSQFLPLNINSNKRYFYSEWCAEALKIKESNKYSPQDLYERIKNVRT